MYAERQRSPGHGKGGCRAHRRPRAKPWSPVTIRSSADRHHCARRTFWVLCEVHYSIGVFFKD